MTSPTPQTGRLNGSKRPLNKVDAPTTKAKPDASPVRAAMLVDLARSGLDAQDAKLLQLSTVPHKLEPKKAGYQIPYFDADGKKNNFFRVRFTDTTLSDFDKAAGEKPRKYTQPPNTLPAAYLAPYIDWRKVFAGTEPVMITEGEKKAAKATKEGISTIGLGGVWSFMSKKHKMTLLPIFDEMNLKDREIYICYDSDVVTKGHVQTAEATLAQRLMEKGAHVRICRFPADGDNKVGLDDYLLTHSAEEFRAEILEHAHEPDSLDLHNFYFVAPANKVLYLPTAALWVTQAVDALLPAIQVGTNDKGAPVFQTPHKWLAKNRAVTSTCHDPALPQINDNMVAREAGFFESAGDRMYNRYLPASIELGDAKEGEKFWAAHVHKLFPNHAEADHIINWCAHRVQKPGEKVRHALLIGGAPGIGKDTIFEAMLPAMGEWNCTAIAPDKLFSGFNEFAAKVFVRVNEVVDLHEMNRFKFYEATKTLIAGSPDFVEVNPKYGIKYYTRNCAGVVMTTNHPTTGIYLPHDDRRHFVVESIPLWGTDTERNQYFKRFWDWLNRSNGYAHVAAFLHSVDLSKFDPNAPPTKTECFAKIVANSMTGDTWLSDALEKLGNPQMVRADVLRTYRGDMTPEEFSRRIGQAISRAGYTLLPNPDNKDGRHQLPSGTKSGNVKTAVYHVLGCNVATEFAKLKKQVPAYMQQGKF